MSEKCKVTAKVITNVKLGCTEIQDPLPYGKWNQNPVDQIAPNTEGTVAFIAQGRDGSATGTEGYVKYQAADGTTFKMYFDDPYSASNNCTISAEGGSPLMYSYKVEYPKSGRGFDAKFTITYNAS